MTVVSYCGKEMAIGPRCKPMAGGSAGQFFVLGAVFVKPQHASTPHIHYIQAIASLTARPPALTSACLVWP